MLAKLRGLIWQRRMARFEADRRRLPMQIRACLRKIDAKDQVVALALLEQLHEQVRCTWCGSLVRERARLRS